MSPHLQAGLFAAFVALVFVAGFGTALWFSDLSRQIDEATRLPQHPHHRPVEYPTERIPTNNVIDMPRRGPKEWTA